MAVTPDSRLTFVEPGEDYLPLKANAKTFYGALVMTEDASIYVITTAKGTARTVRGIAMESVDNTGGSNGDLKVHVRWDKDVLLKNDGATPVGNDDIGKLCYVEDNDTVTMDDTGTVPAGIVRGFEGSLVRVGLVPGVVKG